MNCLDRPGFNKCWQFQTDFSKLRTGAALKENPPVREKETSFAIATMLANVYSWTSNNIENEFADEVTKICPHVSRGAAVRILKSFDELDPLDRDSATFDLTEFVKKEISAL